MEDSGTQKGHGGLQREPYGAIQDEILFAKSHKENHVGRGGLIILTRDDGVPIWCSMLKYYLRGRLWKEWYGTVCDGILRTGTRKLDRVDDKGD